MLILALTVLVLGPLGYYFERANPESNIKSILDGMWWAIVSITTVGYGDRYPVTTGGKMIAVFLMFLGIGTFFMVTGNISSFLTKSGQAKDLEEIKIRLESIEKNMDKKRSSK